MNKDAFIDYIDDNYDKLKEDFINIKQDDFNEFCLCMFNDDLMSKADNLRDEAREAELQENFKN